ncbi:MAG TPA: TrmH family RNA methyltransferase, partial [Pyrinomonadaceae bacterium]|nr:TrmH family RNA methyltransferase [Pyrinomonadaceae bacterium]
MITSRDNSLVRHARAVRDGKVRGQIFIEGVRLCEEAGHAALAVKDVLYTERIASDERGSRLLDELKKVNAHAALVSEQVLSSISDTKTPQGIIVLAGRPRTGPEVLENNRAEATLIIIMHRINNPANAGAILRTAEAAGATGAIATEGSTDLFSPKALRGAMGSSFRLPAWDRASFSGALAWCAEHNIRTVSMDSVATRLYTDVDWTGACALIVGA